MKVVAIASQKGGVGKILKNAVATKETATERIFLMKDLAAVEEAVGLGAKIVEGEVAF